jgi:carbon monoxide dehydrogenase subunit G
MASIRREMSVAVPAASVWSAVRDFGAPHKRLAPGFLVDSRLEGEGRVVTFANGLVARELLVDVDEEARRLVWAVVGSKRLTHHNASLQVFPEGETASRVVWVADLLPHDVAGDVQALIDAGMRAMKTTLERAA